jgi:hypothetical protein
VNTGSPRRVKSSTTGRNGGGRFCVKWLLDTAHTCARCICMKDEWEAPFSSKIEPFPLPTPSPYVKHYPWNVLEDDRTTQSAALRKPLPSTGSKAFHHRSVSDPAPLGLPSLSPCSEPPDLRLA